MSSQRNDPARPGRRLIFVKWITTRSGKRLYARAYGREAWAIWVPDADQGK